MWRSALLVRRSLAAAATVTTLALAQLCFAQAGKAAADLPAGPMQAKATTACTECHETRIVLQQRLNQAAWTREVDKMIQWGAVVDPADRDALIGYLSTNFGTDKEPYQAPRTASERATSPKKSAKTSQAH